MARSNNEGSLIGSVIVLLVLLIFGVVECNGGCDDVGKSNNALTSAGYTDVHLEGHAVFQCGGDDSSAVSFTAKNPQGQVVSGVVCGGGVFGRKGYTIRF